MFVYRLPIMQTRCYVGGYHRLTSGLASVPLSFLNMYFSFHKIFYNHGLLSCRKRNTPAFRQRAMSHVLSPIQCQPISKRH